jgi:hypothetical protein
MNDDEYEEEEEEDSSAAFRRRLLLGLAAVAGSVALIFLWLWLSRPSEDVVSKEGFDFGAPVASIPFEAKPRTGIASVSIGSALDEPALSSAAAVAPSAAGAPAGAPLSTEDAAALAAAGAPKDNEGYVRVGARRGLLSRVLRRVIKHPTAMRLLLNNGLLVNAFFSRPDVQERCENRASLKSFVMNSFPKGPPDPTAVNDPDYLPIVPTFLRDKDAMAAAADTRFGAKMLACPAVRQLSSDQNAVAQIVAENPSLVSVMTNRTLTSALAGNTEAKSVLGAAQQSLVAAPAAAAP